MKRYVAMLRGVNVGGHNRIAMRDLKSIFEEQGYLDVITYLQSGNVVFNSNSNDSLDLANSISGLIKKHYNYTVPVFIKTADAMKKTISNNPFIKQLDTDKAKLHVTFLSSTPDRSAIQSISSSSAGNDECLIKDHIVYLYCPDGYGRTKLTNTFFEQKLAVNATTRNWKTVTTLTDMVSKQ